MAGKKRKSIQDDVKLSKTARASKGKKKDEGFLASGDMDRIIPLCGGKWAYILDPRDGKTHHVQVGSEKWSGIIGDLLNDPKFSPKISSQLSRLGWNAPV